MSHASIEHWLGRHQPRLADMLDRTPGMADVIRDICEGMERYLAVHRLEPEDLSPTIAVTPDGKLVLDLLSETWSQQPDLANSSSLEDEE